MKVQAIRNIDPEEVTQIVTNIGKSSVTDGNEMIGIHRQRNIHENIKRRLRKAKNIVQDRKTCMLLL